MGYVKALPHWSVVVKNCLVGRLLLTAMKSFLKMAGLSPTTNLWYAIKTRRPSQHSLETDLKLTG